jgi:hypothetical protein
VNGTVSVTVADTATAPTPNASDVYKWSLGANEDVRLDSFDASLVASKGGDVLDLRDLLVGEDGSGDTFNLDKFLHFSQETSGGETNVVISVDHNGSSANPSNAFDAGQQIRLEGMTLTGLKDALGAASTSDLDLLHKMLENGNLKTDT